MLRFQGIVPSGDGPPLWRSTEKGGTQSRKLAGTSWEPGAQHSLPACSVHLGNARDTTQWGE